MKPSTTLGQAPTPDGGVISLHEHDGDFILKLNGRPLMSTRETLSERLLGELAAKPLGRRPAKFLIGGLGLGYTMQRLAEFAGPEAEIEVAELIPDVIAWNLELLGPEHAAWMADPRVKILQTDVFRVIKNAAPESYHGIILDVDNGPDGDVKSKNARIYRRRGLDQIWRALHPTGQAIFWSAYEDFSFPDRLREAGFVAQVIEARPYETAKRAAHRIYVGRRRREDRG